MTFRIKPSKIAQNLRETMKLYLMRHGIAEDVAENDGKRALTAEGMAELQTMAAHLATSGLKIQQAIHSPKLRANMTAHIMAEHLGIGEVVASRLKFDHIDELRNTLELIDDCHEDTLLVGHMPFMAELLGQLVLNHVDQNLIYFVPATMVCLEKVPGQGWRINWSINPSLF